MVDRVPKLPKDGRRGTGSSRIRAAPRPTRAEGSGASPVPPSSASLTGGLTDGLRAAANAKIQGDAEVQRGKKAKVSGQARDDFEAGRVDPILFKGNRDYQAAYLDNRATSFESRTIGIRQALATTRSQNERAELEKQLREIITEEANVLPLDEKSTKSKSYLAGLEAKFFEARYNGERSLIATGTSVFNGIFAELKNNPNLTPQQFETQATQALEDTAGSYIPLGDRQREFLAVNKGNILGVVNERVDKAAKEAVQDNINLRDARLIQTKESLFSSEVPLLVPQGDGTLGMNPNRVAEIVSGVHSVLVETPGDDATSAEVLSGARYNAAVDKVVRELGDKEVRDFIRTNPAIADAHIDKIIKDEGFNLTYEQDGEARTLRLPLSENFLNALQASKPEIIDTARTAQENKLAKVIEKRVNSFDTDVSPLYNPEKTREALELVQLGGPTVLENPALLFEVVVKTSDWWGEETKGLRTKSDWRGLIEDLENGAVSFATDEEASIAVSGLRDFLNRLRGLESDEQAEELGGQPLAPFPADINNLLGPERAQSLTAAVERVELGFAPFDKATTDEILAAVSISPIHARAALGLFGDVARYARASDKGEWLGAQRDNIRDSTANTPGGVAFKLNALHALVGQRPPALGLVEAADDAARVRAQPGLESVREEFQVGVQFARANFPQFVLSQWGDQQATDLILRLVPAIVSAAEENINNPRALQAELVSTYLSLIPANPNATSSLLIDTDEGRATHLPDEILHTSGGEFDREILPAFHRALHSTVAEHSTVRNHGLTPQNFDEYTLVQYSEPERIQIKDELQETARSFGTASELALREHFDIEGRADGYEVVVFDKDGGYYTSLGVPLLLNKSFAKDRLAPLANELIEEAIGTNRLVEYFNKRKRSFSRFRHSRQTLAGGRKGATVRARSR